MRKKMIAAVMCMVLCFSAVSCGKKDDEGKDAGTTPEATPTVGTEATPTAEATTEPEATPTTEAEATPTAEAGDGEENKYSSKDYGFEITVPEDFIIYDEATSLGIIYQSMALLYQSVDDMMAAFETVGIKYPFVSVTTKPVSNNASANIITQLCPASALPGTLEDVVKQSLAASEQQYTALGVTPTSGEPEIIQVDGKDICVADSSVYLDGDFGGVTYNDFTLYQKIIAFDSGSNRIMISCTYYNEDEGKAMTSMVDTIRILK